MSTIQDLDKFFEDKTFIHGERLTIADLAFASSVKHSLVESRLGFDGIKAYKHFDRYYQTIINQPEFENVDNLALFGSINPQFSVEFLNTPRSGDQQNLFVKREDKNGEEFGEISGQELGKQEKEAVLISLNSEEEEATKNDEEIRIIPNVGIDRREFAQTIKQQPMRQLQSTIREDSTENDENVSPVFHTPEAEHNAMPINRCRPILEEEPTSTSNSRPVLKQQQQQQLLTTEDYQFDDLIPRQTPPRSYPRQSIGQWSVERQRNNMSVRSLVSSLEDKTGSKSSLGMRSRTLK